MPVSIPLVAPELSSSLVLLRQLDMSVFDDYREMLGDAEVSRWTGPAGPFSDEQIKNWLSTRSSQPDRLDWAIFDVSSSEFAGEVVLNELDAELGSMNIRIALRAGFLNRGLGTEAMQLACDYAFESVGLAQITLGVMVDNLRAQRSYEKCGFVPGEQYEEDGIAYLAMTLAR
jgi:RimJ/RimL family protein N-acetyltransferase